MEEIVFCPHCHHPNPKDAKVCEACGASLSSEEESELENEEEIPSSDDIFAPAYKERRRPSGEPIQVLSEPHSYTYGIAARICLEMNLPQILVDIVLLLFCVAYLAYWAYTKADYDFSFFLIIILIVLEMSSLLNYLLFLPLRMKRTSKENKPDVFRVEIYEDGILMKQSVLLGNEEKILHNKVLFEDLFRIKEYRDIFLLRYSSPSSESTVLVFLKSSLSDKTIRHIESWKTKLKQERKS